MIVKKFVFGIFQTNTILFGCEKKKEVALIDPALGSSKEILNYIKKEGLSLKFILLTHSHWDHIGDTAKLKKEKNILVYVHKEDVDNLISPGKDELPLIEKIEGVEPDGYLEDNHI